MSDLSPLPSDWQLWDTGRLETELRAHNRRYWDEQAPIISDYDYDRLVERLRALAPDSPALDDLGPSRTPGEEVVHATPMLSLGKVYDEKELLNWAGKFDGPVLMSPKIDGVACSIRYERGVLVQAATRGSGTVGEDITQNVRRIKDIPTRLPNHLTAEIRGEVYMKLSTFRQFAAEFANPRNTTAGALKQKDADESARRQLSFFAYDLRGLTFDTEVAKFRQLAMWGFVPVEHELIEKDDMQAGYERYVARRGDLDFEIDGVVYRANRVDEQIRLGATSHHPRAAIAYKLQGESATTTLRSVEWSVSRTGALTPVGIIEPTLLSGATVTRISLHNWGLVQAKRLSLGAKVVAMRRGGVIPYLEALVEPGEVPIRPPEACPACGGPVRIEGDFVFCAEPDDCSARRVQVLKHYVDSVGIEGFGSVWLETLFDAGLLATPPDFYRLQAEQLLGFERMGQKLADNLVAEVAAHRRQALDVFLRALGVPDLGKTASGTLARHFRTLKAVREATAEDLLPLPKFAEILARKVIDGLAARAPLIDELLEFVTLEPMPEAAAPIEGPLSGKTFLFTATLAAMGRKAAQARVEALGGGNASGVSGRLSYLVVGSEGRAGSKLARAEKAGATVLSEADFLALLAEHEG